MRNNTQNFKLCSTLNYSPNVQFMAPMEYSPNGKGIMTPMEYTPMVYSPSGKGIALWKIVFELVIAMVKDKKRQHKRCNVNKNQFYALREVDKKNAIVFEEFELVCIFVAIFSMSLSTDKRSTLAKIWGNSTPPPQPPGFYGAVQCKYANIIHQFNRKISAVIFFVALDAGLCKQKYVNRNKENVYMKKKVLQGLRIVFKSTGRNKLIIRVSQRRPIW